MSTDRTDPPSANRAFTAKARTAVYQAIFTRRGVRGQFLPKPVPDDVLARIITAAHHAPSVGFMQPWNFLVVRSAEIKRRVHAAFAAANAEATVMFEGQRRATYATLKLEGILESPVGICITCDRARTGPVVVGRTHMKTMDLYSSHFFEKPELETAGWLPRLPVEELVYFDQWGRRDASQALIGHLVSEQAAL